MRPVTLSELLNWLEEELLVLHPQELSTSSDSTAAVMIKGISTDTRTIAPGEAFLALKGERYDGHSFCEQAIERGATMLIVNADMIHFLNEASPKLRNFPKIGVRDTLRALGLIAKGYRRDHLTDVKLIAITGSIGKTSTKYWIARIGKLLGYKVWYSQKSFNNEVGVPLTILNTPEDTKFLILEFGARNRGDISYLSQVATPQVGLVRSIAPVHLETFGSIREIAREKLSLLREALEAGGLAVAPTKLKRWMKVIMPEHLSDVTWVTTGRLKVSYHIGQDEISTQVRLFIPTLAGDKLSLNTSLRYPIPRFQLENMMIGLRLWELLNGTITRELISEALENPHIPDMRGKLLRAGELIIIDDSYNSSPWALRESLKFLMELGVKPAAAIIGDMLELGRHSKRYHKWIAKFLSQLDKVWLYGKEVEATYEALKPLNIASLYPPSEYEAMRDNVRKAVTKGEVRSILIKGSRALALDRVVRDLIGGEPS